MSRDFPIWRTVTVVLVVIFALVVSYPLHTKVIREEQITEKYEHGRWVKGETKVLSKSLLSFAMTPRETKTTIEREYQEGGSKYRVKRVQYMVPGKIKLGLDLRGGAELLYRIRVKPEDDRANIAREVISILEKRIDPQGVLEYRIQQQGNKRVLVQVPGATKDEIERLKKRIVTMGKLEFRLCETEPSRLRSAEEDKPVAGCYKHWVGLRKGEVPDPRKPAPRWYLVQNSVELTGEYIADVYPTFDKMESVVGFKMNQKGSKLFARITERNVNAPLAIILDEKLVSAPIIEERIAGSGIIRGSFTQTEVNDLVATLRAGSLPADLELEMGNAVGPSLGADSIRQGIRAVVVGSLLVLVFVAAYYLWVGAVADFALLLNLALVTAALSLFQATLTLPGIAGLVLTVGMAIDANVLIFERIREEKAKPGKSIKNAIDTGYKKAFLTIIDANLTTLITAVILYIVGTGPVWGFAVTLSLGIIFSMFTALFVTRTIFKIGLVNGMVTEMRMRQLFPRPSIQFLKHRRIAATVSAVLIFVGIATFLVRGRANYDIDFTGGTLVQLSLDEAANVHEVRTTLKDSGYGDAEVQSIWEGGEVTTAATRDFGIRIKDLTPEQVQDKIRTDVAKALQQGLGLASLQFLSPREAQLTLKRKAEESEVSARLANAGYAEEDVKKLLALDAAADRYEIWWGSLKDKSEAQKKGDRGPTQDPREAILRYLEMSGAVRVASNVKLSFGDKIEAPEVSLDAPRGAPKESQLSLDLSLPVDIRLLQAEIGKICPKVRTHARAVDRERDIGRHYTLSGSKADLERLLKAGAKTMKAPAAMFRDKHVLTVTLTSAQQERSFREAVLAACPFSDQIRRVAPLGVGVQRFKVVFGELRGEKVQEKIRTDILAAFKGKLHKTKIDVKFLAEERAAPSAEGKGESATLTAGAKAQGKAATSTAAAEPQGKTATTTAAAQEPAVRLVFDQETPLWQIKSVLTDAGCADALLEGYTRDDYREVRVRADAVAAPEVQEKIRQGFQSTDPFKRVVSIGSAVAGEMKNRAILAMIFAMFAIVVYIWMRFGELKFGIAAVIALLHDVLFAVGAVSIAGWLGGTSAGHWLVGDIKINLPLVAAFLTIVGYSLNDTIVIFVRIRENMGTRHRSVTQEVLDNSINQTLSRTLLTSFTTLCVVLALYFLGGSVIHGFALALTIGVVVGTYSSVFIASPVLLEWEKVTLFFKWLFLPLRLPFILLRLAFGRRG